jgi:hypothetical protein
MDNNDTMPDLLGLIPQKPKEPGAKSPVKKKRHAKPKPADRKTDYTFANLIAQPFSHQISFQLPEKLRLDINISLNNHKNAGRFDHIDLSDVIRAALAAYFARGMPLTEISDTAPKKYSTALRMNEKLYYLLKQLPRGGRREIIVRAIKSYFKNGHRYP